MAQNDGLEIRGLDELIERVNDPELLRGPLTGLLLRAGTRGRNTAREEIQGGTGLAYRSISRQFDRQKMEVKVYTNMGNQARAWNIERGRPANGPLPSTRAIARWMRASGLPGHEARAVAAMAHRIRRQGVTGKRFIGKAFEAIQENMPRYLADAARQIEQRFLKKHGHSVWGEHSEED